MEKNENMNQNSVASIKEFKEKNIQSNICLHKIFIILLAIINIPLIIFLIIYKMELSKINQKISFDRSTISLLEKKIKSTNTLANKKVVNVVSQTKKGYITYLFETSEEVKAVKNLILSKKNIPNINIKMQMIFQGHFDGDDFKDVISKERPFNKNILFLIREDAINKFGFFFESGFSYESKDSNFNNKNCFIFSFKTMEIYNYIGEDSCFKYINNQIIFGKNDVIIDNNFFGNNCIINFPFNSFDIKNIQSNVFTSTKGMILLEDIEIYHLYFEL